MSEYKQAAPDIISSWFTFLSCASFVIRVQLLLQQARQHTKRSVCILVSWASFQVVLIRSTRLIQGGRGCWCVLCQTKIGSTRNAQRDNTRLAVSQHVGSSKYRTAVGAGAQATLIWAPRHHPHKRMIQIPPTSIVSHCLAGNRSYS